MAIIAREGNLFARIVRVPAKLMYIWAKVEHLQAKSGRLLFVHLFIFFVFVNASAQELIHALTLVILPLFKKCKIASLFVLLRVQLTCVIHTGSVTGYCAHKVILYIILRCLLFHFFAKHAFEGSQNFLLIILPKHVCKLGDFTTLF